MTGLRSLFRSSLLNFQSGRQSKFPQACSCAVKTLSSADAEPTLASRGSRQFTSRSYGRPLTLGPYESYSPSCRRRQRIRHLPADAVSVASVVSHASSISPLGNGIGQRKLDRPALPWPRYLDHERDIPLAIHAAISDLTRETSIVTSCRLTAAAS
jgi:hypothetical protein